MSTERVSRIKHDKHPINTLIKEYPFLRDAECVWHSYTVDDTLEELADSEYKRLLYKLYTPKFIKGLASITDGLQQKRRERVLFYCKSLVTHPVSLFRLLQYKFLEVVLNNDEYYLPTSKWFFKKDIARSIGKNTQAVTLFEHHRCHAHGSYCMSPFFGKDTAVFVLDGWWDWEYSSLRNFESEKKYTRLWSSKISNIPNNTAFDVISIWNVYSLFTETIGLRHRSDEWKVEALAAYWIPDQQLVDTLHRCFQIDEEKNCWKIDYKTAKMVFSQEFLNEQALLLWKENFCASVQNWLETTIVQFLTCMQSKHWFKRLIISWWVMANVIANMKIFESQVFEEMYITPCMSDEWSWLGAATLLAVEHDQDISWLHENTMPYRWDEISSASIQTEINKEEWTNLIAYTHIWKKRPIQAAHAVAQWKIVALVQWRMEFWPRALWNRSITANPWLADIKNRINLHVKKRPEYQPFCPSILEEERERLFESSFSNKHMSIAFKFKKAFRKLLPWAMHIDGTARPQFVSESDNPLYFQYLEEVKKLTGYGVVINTSFNMHWRTIVRTAEDAVRDFIDCGIDVLVLWDYIITRK